MLAEYAFLFTFTSAPFRRAAGLALVGALVSESAISGPEDISRLKPQDAATILVHDLYLMAFGGLLLAAVLLDDLADRVKSQGILLVLALGLLVTTTCA